MDKVAVIGAGAWGTTIANLMAKKGLQVLLWTHHPDNQQAILNHQSPYLPGVTLDSRLKPTTLLTEALTYSSDWMIAVPSKYIPEIVPVLQHYVASKVRILSLVKGMIFLERPLWLSDYFKETFPILQEHHFSILSGPNFAVEIAQNLMAATVVSCIDGNEAVEWQKLLSTDYFRVYTNTDLIGVQLGGVMKNIIALAAGILDGQQMGSNLKSALIVRGINEMRKLAFLVGANPDTLSGLSGLGDLIGTCTSPLSRNLWAGTLISQGKTVDDIRKTHRTVESIEALPAVLAMVKGKVEMPISEALYSILFEGKPLMTALHELMVRTSKPE